MRGSESFKNFYAQIPSVKNLLKFSLGINLLKFTKKKKPI